MYPHHPQQPDFGYALGHMAAMLTRISAQQDATLDMSRQILDGQRQAAEKLNQLPPPKPEIKPIEAVIVRALTWILPMLALGGAIKWEDVAKFMQHVK